MVSSEADHIAPTQDSRVFVLTDDRARDEIEAKFLIEDTASVAQVIDGLRAHKCAVRVCGGCRGSILGHSRLAPAEGGMDVPMA